MVQRCVRERSLERLLSTQFQQIPFTEEGAGFPLPFASGPERSFCFCLAQGAFAGRVHCQWCEAGNLVSKQPPSCLIHTPT